MATKDITDIQVLRAQELARKNPIGHFGYEILSRETGEPEKVCYRALERAYRRGLLKCGLSLRTAWLSDSGRAMLEQKHNLEDK